MLPHYQKQTRTTCVAQRVYHNVWIAIETVWALYKGHRRITLNVQHGDCAAALKLQHHVVCKLHSETI
jgi:hypothetical protein